MREVSFGDVSELLSALHSEEAISSRFAVQFILVNGLAAWRDLLSALRAECLLFRLSERCTEQDLLPYLGDLRTDLERAKGSRILLLPLGELLHLAPGQAPLRELASWVPARPKRVYVPILERRELLTRELEGNARYRGGECALWSVGGAGRIDIHAVPVPIAEEGRRIVHGVRAYLELWEQGGAESIQLVSSWASGWSQAERIGRLHFHVSPDGYSALVSLIPEAQRFPPDAGQEDNWRWLAGQARSQDSLEKLVGRLLNTMQADAQSLLDSWPRLGPQERWLAWLWTRTLPLSNSFADKAMRQATSWHAVEETIANIALAAPLSLQHVAERLHLLSALGMEDLVPSFWATLETQADPLVRLQALPGFTARQKERIIQEVANLIDSGIAEDTWLSIVELTFPALATYLSAFPYDDAFVRDYLRHYVRSRICDTLLPELAERDAKWAENKSLWTYPTRANLLMEQSTPNDQRLWVDALGVEWAGLLHTLLNDEEYECGVQVGRAELPTSTSYNREWSLDEQVERELDNSAHAVGYAHPRSLVSEIHFVVALAEEVRARCQNTGQVLVTGDHGLTRFACMGKQIAPPDGYTVHRWGRYAYGSPRSPEAPSSDEWLTHNDCLILAHHGLFRGGARTGGEVHGGATLEEALVPVLAVRRRSRARPAITLSNANIRPQLDGSVRLSITVSEPVSVLRLSLTGRILDAKHERDNLWVIDLGSLLAGSYRGWLQYEYGLVGEISFEVLRRGIMQDDMGLPD